MNSYGDSSSSRGRAQIPGPGGDPGPGADDVYRRSGGDSGGSGWSAPAGAASPGRASVTPRAAAGGRASVGGSAAVPPRGGAAGSASVGSAAAGRAGAGRASVPVSPAPGAGRAGAGRASVPVSPAPGGPAGRAAVGAAAVGAASAGRASVGSASVGGRAAVARASVSPVSGGPGGPGGPNGPGRGGRGGRGPGDPGAAARAKKRKRMNLLIAGFAVFIMLAGLGVVSFTYYSTNVVMPEEMPLPLSTTVYAKDNKTALAKLGSENRSFVTIKDIPQHVQDAVAAAEDRNFYRHSGVDYKGIVRAAWNNVSGGDKQGASTITQQYARNAFENLKDDTYGRKVKEAILASKLNDKYDKPTIMQHYLNVIYFGRGAYGIEAAAQTYFGHAAKELTVAEGAVLAALIKQPVASDTHRGYDPAVNPTDAKSRWQYVIDGMKKEGWLDAPGRPQSPTAYPKVQPPSKDGVGFGVKSPRGNVVNYVRQEMDQMGLCSDTGAAGKTSCVDALRDGGYRIQTSIDPKLQTAAENIAMQSKKGSELNDQPKNLMAAVVSIDPKKGRVLAYYGGDSGADFDYAGKNTDKNGDLTGGHPPGSSMKVYTLAAAIDAGISVKSHWDPTPFKPENARDEIGNANRTNLKCGKWCTLEESTIQSYNVPFYHVADKIGADKVVGMAAKAGVTTMWGVDPPQAFDLAKAGKEKNPFDQYVAFGKYPITVLDHANGLATLANDGKYIKAHFVIKVEQQDQDTGKWKVVASERIKPQQRIDKKVTDEVAGVLKQIPGPNKLSLDNGRQAAGKTGTWEYDKDDNAHAWMVGYTPQIATAVWVGSRDPKKPEIRLAGGKDIGGSTLPGPIWEKYMNTALKGQDEIPLPSVTGEGDTTAGNGKEPAAPPPPIPGQPGGQPGQPGQQPCDPLTNPFCPRTDGDNGGGNNPGRPGGGNGGGLLPSTPPTTYRD
ncbi:transglycosylase domain-containing protein [Micromonospora sp. GCM10011542]|uniref:transglycosylase domain-containing protein n=1 Tax=Micromonospora sp. GCM10011542 TaxID=3317337 RepID=UPI00360C43BD